MKRIQASGFPALPSFWKRWKLEISRAAVATLLVASAVIFTVFTYHLIWKGEHDVYKAQYDAISDELLQGVKSTVGRLHGASASMATSVSLAFPNSSAWPNAYVMGYSLLNDRIYELTNAKVAHTPIVWPDQVSSFEAFAQSMFALDPDVPEDSAGYSDFGFGVFALDDDSKRYHDTTGATNFSQNTFMTPILHSAFPSTTKAFLFNTHSEKTRGMAMDAVYECSQSHSRDSGLCPTMSDIIQHISLDVYRPTTLLYSPIYAFDDKKLVGFATGSFSWDTALVGLLSHVVDAVDCVVSTQTQQYTIELRNGEPVLKGQGDLHERRFDSDIKSTEVYLDTFVNSSTVYTVSIYPTSALYNSYHSHTAVIATVSCLSLVVLTMIVVVFYDQVVKEERYTKDNLLKHKRAFVRFVSHEVRTPLNSVDLGLRFLEEELQQKIKTSRHEHVLRDAHQCEDECKGGTEKTETVPVATSNNSSDAEMYLSLAREIHTSCNVAVAVLNDYLQYDKIEAGKFTLESKHVLIQDVVRDNSRLFQVQASEARVKLEVLLDSTVARELDQSSGLRGQRLLTALTFHNYARQQEDSGKGIQAMPVAQDAQQAKVEELFVIGDGPRLGQVVRNLVSNAIKFSPPDSTVSVSLAWNPEGLPSTQRGERYVNEVKCTPSGSVILSVRDSGPGLSSSHLQQLFGEGVQFNPNELQGGQGSGLGLWISKGIVEMHDGRVWAESDGIDCGSAFYVELPVVECPDIVTELQRHGIRHQAEQCVVVDNGTISSSLTVVAENLDDRKKKELSVLVVDDSPLNRKCVVRLLEKRGHKCLTAEDGEESVKIMQSMSPEKCDFDCILMDNEMPKMKGPDAVMKIRSMGFSKLKIFGLTGNLLPEDIRGFVDAGVDIVLEKPFNIDKFEDLMFQPEGDANV